MEAVAIDMSAWKPDKSYDECLALCTQLGLIEMLTHGDDEYARMTQTGCNVLHALMRLVVYAANPENAMKQT